MPHSLSCMTVKGELKQVLSPPAGISSQIITPRAPATWKRFKQRDPLEFSSYSQSSIFFYRDYTLKEQFPADEISQRGAEKLSMMLFISMTDLLQPPKSLFHNSLIIPAFP